MTRILTAISTEKAKRDFDAGQQAYWHGQPRRMGMPPSWLAGWGEAKREHERRIERCLNEGRERDFIANQRRMELARRGAGNRTGTSGGARVR